MTENNLRTKTITSFIWRFAERFSAQIISFVVSIILARILSPEDYGIVALVLVVTNIMQVFVDSGLANALIQKKDVDDLDYSSVFYFNIILCILLYIVLYISSPLFSYFYENNDFIYLFRVLGLTVIVSGVKNVQQAYVSKTLQFRKFFFATIIGTIFSAIIGIILAISGYGVWAIIVQYLSNICIDTLVLWIIVRWRPKRIFSIKRLKHLLSYGWKLLVSGLLDSFYQNIWQFIIGKIYSPSDLAFYNQANKLPNVIISNVNTSIDSVLLPVLSKEQDDLNNIKSMTRRAIKTAVYIISPLMIGLAATSEVIVKLLLTEKWLPCVPYLVIFSITYIFMPIHTANLNAIKALGRSDIFLKLEIVKKIIGVICLFISVRMGVLAMAWMVLIINFLCQLINTWPNKKMLNYGYIEQIKDIIPTLLISAVMGIIVYFIKFLFTNIYITFLIQVFTGIVIYIFLSIFFKIDSFFYLYGILKSLKKKSS